MLIRKSHCILCLALAILLILCAFTANAQNNGADDPAGADAADGNDNNDDAANNADDNTADGQQNNADADNGADNNANDGTDDNAAADADNGNDANGNDNADDTDANDNGKDADNNAGDDNADDNNDNGDNGNDDDENGDDNGKGGGKKNGKGGKGNNNNADNDDDDADNDNDDATGNGNKGAGRASGKTVKTRLLCQDKNGNFLPIATVCRDVETKSFCKKVFPKNPKDPNGRPQNCDLHGMEPIAHKCAHHCKICCELAAHGCGDDPTYHINCENRRNLCHNMTEMMTSACAATCGFCNRGPCADTANGCIGLRSMCRHHKEFGGDLMQCARTCGFCTAKCVDLSNDCGIAEQSACARPPDDHPEENPYYEAMSKVCRKGCDLCNEPMQIDTDHMPDDDDNEESDNGNGNDDDDDNNDDDDNGDDNGDTEVEDEGDNGDANDADY